MSGSNDTYVGLTRGIAHVDFGFIDPPLLGAIAYRPSPAAPLWRLIGIQMPRGGE